MTPGETWTFETLELAGILELSKSRPLLVGNWAPEGGKKKGSSNIKTGSGKDPLR